MTKYCSNCGTKSASATAKFCASCGQSLDTLTSSSPKKTARARVLEEDDPDGSDITEVPQLDSLKFTTEADEENADHFGKTFSFGMNGFGEQKFKPRSLTL